MLTAAATLSYAWGTSRQQPEVFYAAAVRSMAGSWHDFVYGAFDPAGTMSVDKLPGALWLQALSVRVFGVHVWALNLPQVFEGALTVPVLYRAVRRMGGAPAALAAAVVLVLTPASIALNRGNVSDSLLILLLVCAVDALGAALVSGRVRWLLLAGLWVGLAFQAKMLQAWLIVPGLILVWLLAAPVTVPARRRWGAALGMLVVTVAVSVSWLSAVSLIPRHDRPYVDGSNHDSLFAQVFGYNGFDRTDTSHRFVGGGLASAIARRSTLDSYSRVDRLFDGPGGRAVGWLLPAALIMVVCPLIARRRAPRTDVVRAGVLVWGWWLVIDAAAFFAVNTINAYYLAALGPPIAALVGLGVVEMRRTHPPWVTRAGALIAAGTVLYGWVLVRPAPTPVWVGVVLAGIAVGALLLISSRRRLGLLLAVCLIAPAVASVDIVTEEAGPFVTPFAPAGQRALNQQIATTVDQSEQTMAALVDENFGVRYPAAVQSSWLASPLIFASGAEVLPIGGFTGTFPSPTLGQLIGQVKAGRLHTFILDRQQDPRATWVRAHCRAVPTRSRQFPVYYCT